MTTGQAGKQSSHPLPTGSSATRVRSAALGCTGALASNATVWLPKIDKRLLAPGKDDTLVVVGALHLLGPDGVVEKLRAKGYRVERVCSACSRVVD